MTPLPCFFYLHVLGSLRSPRMPWISSPARLPGYWVVGNLGGHTTVYRPPRKLAASVEIRSPSGPRVRPCLLSQPPWTNPPQSACASPCRHSQRITSDRLRLLPLQAARHRSPVPEISRAHLRPDAPAGGQGGRRGSFRLLTLGAADPRNKRPRPPSGIHRGAAISHRSIARRGRLRHAGNSIDRIVIDRVQRACATRPSCERMWK